MASAQIYQFPTRTRRATSDRREESHLTGSQSSAADLALPTLASMRVANVSFGSGWYHDEAIREAEHARKD